MRLTALSTPAAVASAGHVLVVFIFAALGLVLVSCRSGGDAYSPPQDIDGPYRGAALPTPLPKPQFTLVDTSGAFYDFAAETEGYVTLLYFGYTYCPDICPDHMANIAAVLKRLPEDLSGRVKTVFVSVDPERDTASRLREWLDLFDPSFVGLVGDIGSVDSAMKKTLGDLYFPITREELAGGAYTVSHAAFVLAYTPDDLAHTVYPFGIQQADWEHDIYKLVSQGWLPPSAAVLEPTSNAEPPVSATGPAAEVETPSGTSADMSRGPRRLKTEEARTLLGADFSPVTIEAVEESIDRAFETHPDALRFMSQGLILAREKLDLELRICGSRPEGSSTDSSLLACSTLGGCARLTRILYDYYVQSGYEEFYQAALNVYNYVGTALPAEAEAFSLVVRSELRVTGLPAN